jgi:hypothetical protein
MPRLRKTSSIEQRGRSEISNNKKGFGSSNELTVRCPHQSVDSPFWSGLANIGSLWTPCYISV